MTRILALIPLLSGLVGCGLPPLVWAADPLDAMQQRVISVGKRVSPTVVHIQSAVKQNNRRNLATGSGFLVDAEGIVLTNEHVVERAQRVTVIVPGRDGRYPAEVVGTDKQTDLAVLRISRREGEAPFQVAVLGDSDSLQVGEWVIAIGNPNGLEGTVSLGILSAKGRDLQNPQLLNDFLQTDAMIDRGSSGGPLLNLKGEVIGINSRGQGRGIGFTIPINTAKRVSADLLGKGRIARAYLGISIQPLNRELARYWELKDVHGLIVNGVAEHSPAAAAGLQSGDILLRFDGEAVEAEKDEDLGTFQRRVARASPGKQVAVEVLRDGEIERMQITLGIQPKVVPDEEETDYGFSVQEVTERLYLLHRLDARDGVLVSFVERGSEAAEAGMKVGDLVVAIERAEVSDVESFRAAMETVDTTRPFLVTARRGPRDTRFLLIVPRETAPPRAKNRADPSRG
jgi:S1-C subfamily serine protease